MGFIVLKMTSPFHPGNHLRIPVLAPNTSPRETPFQKSSTFFPGDTVSLRGDMVCHPILIYRWPFPLLGHAEGHVGYRSNQIKGPNQFVKTCKLVTRSRLLSE